MTIKQGALLVGVLLAGGFAAGAFWQDTKWQLRWSERDAAEATALAIAEHGNRLIEKGRIIARDEAVSDAREGDAFNR